MMRLLFRSGAMMALFLTVQPMHAEVIPGRWEKVAALAQGTDIQVRRKAGDLLEGSFRGVDSEYLLLLDASGSAMRVPRESVQSIVARAVVSDRLRNGAWIGAGVGSLAGFLSMLGYAKAVTASGPLFGEEATGYYLAASLVGAGIGAAAGAAADAAVKGQAVLYRAR
jgi:hypothetical protein